MRGNPDYAMPAVLSFGSSPDPDIEHLRSRGWMSIGRRKGDRTGPIYWTTIERGKAGAITTDEAVRIQRAADRAKKFAMSGKAGAANFSAAPIFA